MQAYNVRRCRHVNVGQWKFWSGQVNQYLARTKSRDLLGGAVVPRALPGIALLSHSFKVFLFLFCSPTDALGNFL